MTKIKQILLLFILCIEMTSPSNVVAMEKIDATHYRACIMDLDVVSSEELSDEYSIWDRYPVTNDVYNGILIYDGKAKRFITHQENVTGVWAFASKLYSGNNPSVKVEWWSDEGTIFNRKQTEIFIEVVAPTGISVKKMPSKLLENESSTFECSLTGEFPYFYGYSDAYFEYEFFWHKPKLRCIC